MQLKLVGCDVGTELTVGIGLKVGASVGVNVGAVVGMDVGAGFGSDVGAAVGSDVGTDEVVGAGVGTIQSPFEFATLLMSTSSIAMSL